jgi:2-amino-4-hydroxy-6-hydroxymethyldihydropteridine diphosphokinase
MPPPKIYLSLGSNLGDRLANLRSAIAGLPASGVTVRKVSSIYETEPVDFRDQPWFLNCVLEAESHDSPLNLLHLLQAIESRMGRKKETPKGPRLIDLDILFYADQLIDTPELQIPHPRIAQRRFVLVPLAEIAPTFRHPASGMSVTEMLAQTPDRSAVRRFSEEFD